MLRSLKSLLTVSIFFVSTGLWAQEIYHSPDADLFAHLSFNTSAIVQGDEVRHVCVAVSPDGEYRVERSLVTGTERLEGKMTRDQLETFKKLLGSEQFRALSGDHGGLIRQDAESFTAEIPAKWQDSNSSQRVQWLNADGDRPFPAPMAKVVDWLKHFQPKDGRSFVYAQYPDICPSRGLRLVQPSVAKNQHP
ncbi:MAG TPA: hypothetical protein VMG31_00425 [Verrucomicrobiae bacterium]|nr:hypothetical protein [Verrucomicrobiae bacterium]